MSRAAAAVVVLAIAAAAAGCDRASADTSPPTSASAEDDRPRTAERLVFVLDYVASDYGGAVVDGKVVDRGEYDEQIRMVATARKLAQDLPAVPLALIDHLDLAVQARAPASEVARRCASIRARTVDAYSIAMAPLGPPSFDRGEQIFVQNCVQCHGKTGRGDGHEGRGLDPAPANLLDPERMAPVTPYRAYCDVTYGIEGTAMPAILFPAADRWSVAFYTVGLRHFGVAGKPGAPAPAAAGTAPAAGPKISLATLASASDAALEIMLRPSIPDEAGRAREIARLRAIAPFEAVTGDTPLAFARSKIADAEAAALAGRRAEAEGLVLDAYLRGIEEIEAPLRARDPDLVVRLEDAVAALRAAIAAPPDSRAGAAPAIRARAQTVLAALDRAERRTDAEPVGALMLALAAALIVLREGLEAVLVVAAILAVVRRVGFSPAAARAVHSGWIAAILAGAVTFVAARTVLSRLLVQRELVEASVALLAAAVLFGTSFWLISKADARRWLGYIRTHASGSAASGGLFGLFSIAFLAAYREAFESVLFFEALLAGQVSRAIPLAGGALAGAVVLVFAALAVGRIERRLPIGPFFALSGGLLSGLSVVLLGHGVHGLQAAGVLLPRPAELPRIEWLGLYPDALSSAAQGLLVAAILIATLVLKLRDAADAEGD